MPLIGAVSEYFRRSAAERSREAQVRAIARGVIPWPSVTPGYVLRGDGTLAVVRAMGYRLGQGYFWSRPAPAEQLTPLLG